VRGQTEGPPHEHGVSLGVLEGDGIGAEVVPTSVETARVAGRAVGVTADRATLPLGATAIGTHGTPVPEDTQRTLAEWDGWYLGPPDSVSCPEPHKSALHPSGTLREHFRLFANIRPAKSFPGRKPSATVPTSSSSTRTPKLLRRPQRLRGHLRVDAHPDTAITRGIVTRQATERVARVAFDLARSRRRKLTIVHKANVLKLTTGLFRTVCREVARECPDAAVDDFHIDAMTVHLVCRAQDFDVIVADRPPPPSSPPSSPPLSSRPSKPLANSTDPVGRSGGDDRVVW
jgi:3-isopropylmalate dehydrogenase